MTKRPETTTSREDLCCTWCLLCVEGADLHGCGGHLDQIVCYTTRGVADIVG